MRRSLFALLLTLTSLGAAQAGQGLLGGYAASEIRGGAGMLQLWAVTDGSAEITVVELTYDGAPTGVLLENTFPQVWELLPREVEGAATAEPVLFGLRALNAAGEVVAVWPLLDVPPAPPSSQPSATPSPSPAPSATPSPRPSPTLTPVAIGPTYWGDIHNTVQKNCAGCHVSGGIGPFPLTSYQEVSPLASLIKRAVADRSMPPFPPDPDCNTFQHARHLDEADINLIAQWADNGAPEGDPATTPPADLNLTTVNLGQPDLVLPMSEPYSPDPSFDDYHCFVLDPGLSQDVFVRAIEIVPGNRAIVHHVLVYTDPNSEGPGLDAASPEPGYTCFGNSKVSGTDLFGAWAPGMAPTVFPQGTGLRLRAVQKLIMQIHYYPNGTPQSDQTTLNLYLDPNAATQMQMVPVLQRQLRIPAGADNHLVERTITNPYPTDVSITHVMPHMHLLGTRIQVELTRADGSKECVIDIPRWDFDWQNAYTFETPVQFGPNDRITVRGWYDNSASNPNNPNSPPIEVTWGEGTDDEMLWCGFYGHP